VAQAPLGWAALRRAIYKRDRGICQVCLTRVGRQWDCGHLVERYLGGPDSLENCYLSCVHCNRGGDKPVHTTLPEALAWLAAQQEMARGLAQEHPDWVPFWQALSGR
jgi:5-methylcytosine-specific restriction endonuclease McrA